MPKVLPSDAARPAARPALAGVPTDASAATDRESWLAILASIGAEEGAFDTIGDRHWSFFVEDGPTLLVSFETIETARARDGQMPLAHDIAAARGWSHLCLIADGATWYRDAAVYADFDRRVDEGFFDDFDQVLFYGAGMGAYAACAFSVTAPGAQVLALAPRATQDPALAGWDARDRAARRLDFAARYGYAPDMLDGAGHVTLIFDPLVREDAMHAALFRAPYVSRLPVRLAGDRVEANLVAMGVMPDLIEAAMSGTLTEARFATLWRNRRNYGPYLRVLLAKAAAMRRPALEILICRSVTARLRAPGFAKRLAVLTAAKADTTAGQ